MKLNTIILILATLIIAAGAYWFFFVDKGNDPPLTPQPIVTDQAQIRFQALLGELQPISFNTSIFSDPRFLALVDLTTPIAPETMGRLDPFAPVAGVSARE